MPTPNLPDLAAQIYADMRAPAAFRTFDGQIGDRFDDAYAIQDLVAEQRTSGPDGAPLCGYKIAFNSRAQMRLMKVSEPVSGHLIADQKYLSGAALAASDYQVLTIEPEIVAVIGRRIGPSTVAHDRNSVLGAIEKFVPAFEILDPRGATMVGLPPQVIVSQNIINAGIVIGGPGLLPSELNIDSLTVSVEFDDKEIATMTGAAPQHPLDVVAWMANHLQLRNQFLEAGMVVLCGSHMRPTPTNGASKVKADMSELGQVEFTVG